MKRAHIGLRLFRVMTPGSLVALEGEYEGEGGGLAAEFGRLGVPVEVGRAPGDTVTYTVFVTVGTGGEESWELGLEGRRVG